MTNRKEIEQLKQEIDELWGCWGVCDENLISDQISLYFYERKQVSKTTLRKCIHMATTK
jgi:hypothetical protein